MPKKSLDYLPYIINKITKSAPLNIFGECSRVVEEYKKMLGIDRRIIKKLAPQTQQVIEYFHRAFSVISAFPARSDVVTGIETALCENVNSGITTSSIVNTKSGKKAFFKALSDDDTNVALLVGKRGSGKTFFLNYALNSINTELLHKQTIWYRINLSQLHRININERKKTRYTLNDFLNVCVPYITFRFADGYMPFEKLSSEASTKLNSYSISNWEKINTGFKKEVLGNQIGVIPRYIKLINKRGAIPTKWRLLYRAMRKDIRDILRNSDHLILSEHLRYTIFDYFKDYGYKIILIIDGADNLDYYKHRRQYDALLKDLIDLLNTCDTMEHRDKIAVALRDSTLSHLREFDYNPHSENTEIFYTGEMDFDACLKKRSTVAASSQIDYFNNRIAQGLETILADLDIDSNDSGKANAVATEFIAKITDFANKLPRTQTTLINAISKVCNSEINLNRQNVDCNNLFEKLYNGNLRDFLFIAINIQSIIALADENWQYITDRYYFLLEGFLLNGMLYLNSKEDENPRIHPGNTAMNIFFHDTRHLTDEDHWHGLCLVRILQLLMQANLSESSIIYTLQKSFQYQSLVIKQRLYQATSFGLLSLKYFPLKEEPGSGKCVYSITDKGKFMYFYSFSELTTFYHFALDTPIPNNLLKNSSLIETHTNKDRLWLDFPEACIKTSITFARLIHTTHIWEMNKKTPQELSLYRLPDCFPVSLSMRMSRLLFSIYRRDFQRFNPLKRTLDSIDFIIA